MRVFAIDSEKKATSFDEVLISQVVLASGYIINLTFSVVASVSQICVPWLIVIVSVTISAFGWNMSSTKPGPFGLSRPLLSTLILSVVKSTASPLFGLLLLFRLSLPYPFHPYLSSSRSIAPLRVPS